MVKSKKTINFLSDQPLKCEEIKNDKFDCEGISETVKKVVETSPTPFTIGIFGKWGAGKSTISNFLERKLKKSNFVVVKFDVWKYEKDALRRTFLETLVDELKKQKIIKREYKLEDDFYNTISVTSEGESRFSFSSILRMLPFLIISYVITLVVLFFSRGSERAILGINEILLESLIIPMLLVIISESRHLIVTDQRTTSKKSIESPEQFEKKFEEIVKKIGKKRIVIIIDNLDRCYHEKAIELLSTIKTFLEVPKERASCTFIIPCDDDAIRDHLQNIYKTEGIRGEGFDADEFLRKFFNTYLRIPEFLDTDLQTYTEFLLKETGIKEIDNRNVAFVITAAFRNNPREIKQFINTLLSRYMLAKKREECGLIVPKGAVTNDVSFLTKLLILENKYPKAYEKMKRDNLDSSEISRFGEGQKEKEEKDILEDYKPHLKDFLVSTMSIPRKNISRIKPFIYLKQSSDELNLENAEEIKNALVDNKKEVVDSEILKLRGNSEGVKNLLSFVERTLDDNKRRTLPQLNVILSILPALEKYQIEPENINFYNKIAGYFNSNRENIQFIEPPLLFNQIIYKCDKLLVPKIVKMCAEILKQQKQETKIIEVSNEWAESLFAEIIKNVQLFEKERSAIANAMSEVYYSNINIMSLFRDNEEAQKYFITDATVSKFVQTISENDVENIEVLNSKVDLFLKLKLNVSKHIPIEIIKKFVELLKYENLKPMRNQKRNLTELIQKFLNECEIHIDDEKEGINLEALLGNLVEGVNKIDSWSEKRYFLPPIISMVSILGIKNGGAIDSITNFFNNVGSVDDIKYVFENIPNYKQNIIAKFAGAINNRCVQAEDFFKALWEISNTENRMSIFTAVINSNNYERLIKLLESASFRSQIDKKRAISIILSRIPQIDVGSRKLFYEKVNAMKCGNDAENKKILVSQIKENLFSNDPNSQRLGYEILEGAKSYITKTEKQDIAQETLKTISQRNLITPDHEYSLRSIVLNWGTLTDDLKDNYIHMIVENLLKVGSDPDAIRLGVSSLTSLKLPKKYKKYFDEIRSRIANEGNEEIRRLLTEVVNSHQKSSEKKT